MPGTYTPLNEWSDENSHRQFPLIDAATGKDDTGEFSIAQTLMVDMILAVPTTLDTTKFYIKSMVVRRLFVDIEIGYDDGTALSVGWCRNIPADAGRNTTYYIDAVTQDLIPALEMLTGAIVIGSAESTVQDPGVYTFSPAASYIHPSRVMEGLAGVQSIQVGSDILTGNLILKEGDNITLDVDLVTNTITVNAVLNENTAGVVIGSDADIIDELVSRYGAPIISINGQAPDVDGDFTLAPADCTTIQTVTNGVSIGNPCAEPCCDKSVLSDVYGVLSQLNLRYAVLESYYQSIGLTINQMQARLVGLEV
jgi:hypothetical protein